MYGWHADMRPHMSRADAYHLTVFMTSQPSDPRPDPFVKGGSIDRSAFYQHIPAPQPSILRQEIEAFCALTESTPTPQLQARHPTVQGTVRSRAQSRGGSAAAGHPGGVCSRS